VRLGEGGDTVNTANETGLVGMVMIGPSAALGPSHTLVTLEVVEQMLEITWSGRSDKVRASSLKIW